jgi:hypothetical protein
MWEAARCQGRNFLDRMAALVLSYSSRTIQAGVESRLLRTIHNFMKAPQIILLFMEDH